MFINPKNAPLEKDIHTKICIIGAGVAGITIANELINNNIDDITLLESGDLDIDEDMQALYRSGNTPDFFPSTDQSRLRFFGGSSNHWEGTCKPLSPIDFEKREWVKDSGWPISYDDLVPYYKTAQKYLDLGEFNYTPDYWRKNGKTGTPLAFSTDAIITQMTQHSPPTRFGEKFHKTLADSKNIKTYLNTSVEKIYATSDNRSINYLTIRTPQATHKVFATYFILCCGGIENPRLLLNANIGNEHDLIGRYFMEHPTIDGLTLKPSPTLSLKFYHLQEINNVNISGNLSLSEDILKREKLTNIQAGLIPRSKIFLSTGVDSFHILKHALNKKEIPDHLLDHIGNILSDIDLIAETTSSKKFGKSFIDSAYDFEAYSSDSMIEQTPEFNNRVTLSPHKDKFGQKLVNINWKLSEFDKNNYWRAAKILAENLTSMGYGHTHLRKTISERLFGDQMGFSHHHMGTTRMSANEKKGVVDKNCKMFNKENFYIAGSSVFPTGGNVQPTLTITALAIKLANHLIHNVLNR